MLVYACTMVRQFLAYGIVLDFELPPREALCFLRHEHPADLFLRSANITA